MTVSVPFTFRNGTPRAALQGLRIGGILRLAPFTGCASQFM
jgi:hypothetical protein